MSNAASKGWSWLAWARWVTRIPDHWRPLKVENKGNTGGYMMLGDTTQATVQVKWWSPPEDGFDFDGWIDKQRSSIGASDKAGEQYPQTGAFDRTLWLPQAETRRGGTISVWYGCSQAARLTIEVIINDAAGSDVLCQVKRLVLASMKVSKPNDPIRWAVYDTRFESPAGYSLHESRLNPGAVGLYLQNGKERLLLCQFYPAAAALANQPLSSWLETTALKGKWHSKLKNPDIRDFCLGGNKGLIQNRVMARPFPLDLLGRSHCLSLIIHDQTLDRLLMAEHIHLMKADERLVSDAIEKMNW